MPDLAALLEPLPQRTAAIDQKLRERLIGSLVYLQGFLQSDDWNREKAMDAASARLTAGQVSPWAFGLYATLVQRASKGQLDAARQEFDLLSDVIHAPPPKSVVALNDPAFSPAEWDVARVLFDTDTKRPFLPVAPSAAEFAACEADIASALDLLDRALPDLAQEIRILLRVFLLAAPAGPDAPQQFGAASTFFLWGAIVVNARTRLGVIPTVEVLVHEASHQLLFGLVMGGALSDNDPTARYSSPLRRDPRPIDGIFHAAFVATRVHMAMQRLRDSGVARPEQMPAIDRAAEANGHAAQTAIDLLSRELRPTAAGKEVFDALVAYWQTADALHV